jgi:murein DD-endopeptidase MepM/ murein hydrolase activator NlpD
MAGGDAAHVQVRALAEQFEAMLLAQMLREMKQAMTPDADDEGLGAQLMGDSITAELAQVLGRTQSLGLSSLMEKVRERAPGGGAEPPAIEHVDKARGVPTLPVAETPAVTDASAVRVRAAAVTSSFGWRSDPLNGQHRFHAGLDLRAAYGQDVRAATDGVVTFAGEKPGYGLVVIVSHGSGLETRYAHLSSTTVVEGDRIRGGDLLARTGRSGRATGPHLHFEVRQDGQPVDPQQVAALMPAVGTRGSSAE